MENENKDHKKCCGWLNWCGGTHHPHWFLRFILSVAIIILVFTVGVAMGKFAGRHEGKFSYGFRNERGGNMMYYKQGEFGQVGVSTGGCPMAKGYAQSFPGTFNAFTAPACGAVISGSATLADPYALSDLAEVFTVKGTVTNVTAAKITLTDENRAAKTVNISAETKVKSGDKDGAISDIKTGDSISVVNLPDTNGAMSAQLIRILAK
jgi:hypothetical protein